MPHSSNDSPSRIPSQLIPPTVAVLLNSAESLFTHKLKHGISVAPDPVHSEKQGNYLERAHLGNSAHRRRVGARLRVSSLKLRAHTEYAGKNFQREVKKEAYPKKSQVGKQQRVFGEGGSLACSLHHGRGEYLLGATLLRMAWFQWGFLCCLCFGCGLTGSWERTEKGILLERIGKYQLHEFHDSSHPPSTSHPC